MTDQVLLLTISYHLFFIHYNSYDFYYIYMKFSGSISFFLFFIDSFYLT